MDLVNNLAKEMLTRWRQLETAGHGFSCMCIYIVIHITHDIPLNMQLYASVINDIQQVRKVSIVYKYHLVLLYILYIPINTELFG